MVKLNIKTSTYWINNDFLVDIVETPENYEAFLYSKDYSIKMSMFGCPISQQSYDYFLELVETNLQEHIEAYKNEYMN